MVFRDLTKSVRPSGTVTDASGSPVAGARVIFVASGSQYVSPQRGFGRAADTDQNGAFQGVMLVPGSYRVYVIPDPLQTEQLMDNPAFRQQQEQAIPPVEIVAGENPPLRIVLPAN